MQKDITGKTAQPIGRCGYKYRSWLIPEFHQSKMPTRNTWIRPQIQDNIPDIDATYINGILVKSLDPMIPISK